MAQIHKFPKGGVLNTPTYRDLSRNSSEESAIRKHGRSLLLAALIGIPSVVMITSAVNVINDEIDRKAVIQTQANLDVAIYELASLQARAEQDAKLYIGEHGDTLKRIHDVQIKLLQDMVERAFKLHSAAVAAAEQ